MVGSVVKFLLICGAVAASAYALSWIGFILMVMIIFDGHAGYQKLQTIKDEKTGLFVELGRVDTMLDVDIFLLVFEDDAVRTQISSSGSTAIAEIAKVGSDTDVLSYEDDCYVVRTRGGDLEKPIWRDPHTGEVLCFRLAPRPGPRGGQKP
ncbi:hypothetical protein RUR49_15160 [Pseudoxanthobacter sp. M-2]|uniref:hypothetical protein n=1 Tax=Pseudoxanthobacter sp. M-2 TaxID=3078754 RepID=UPI0038FD35EB